MTVSFHDLKRDIETGDAATRRRAMDQLIRRFEHPLHQHARRVMFEQLRSAMDSTDLLQTVNFKMIKSLEQGRIELKSEAQFLALLKRMIENELVDKSRRRKYGRPAQSLDSPLQTHEQSSELLEPMTPSSRLRQVERDQQLRELADHVRAQLQSEEWYLFRRHFFEGATYDEISAELGKGKDAIRMQLRRLRDKLMPLCRNFEWLLQREDE